MDRADKLVYQLQSEAVHKRGAAVEDLTGPGQLARRRHLRRRARTVARRGGRGGLTPPAWKFPAETTVRSILYHIAYGVSLESIARISRLHDDAPAS
jgi:hypothetical protein